MTHTPTPWILEPNDPFVYALNEKGSNRMSIHIQGGHTDDGKRTTREELVANAEFIHRACRTHNELVAALAETMRVLRHLRDSRPDQYDALVNGSSDYCNMWDRNKQAITKAEKGV